MLDHDLATSELATAVQTGKPSWSGLARLRHALCTPLSAMLGYCEMLMDDVGNEQIAERLPTLQKIWAMGKHLVVQVNALLVPAALDKYQDAAGKDAFSVKLRNELAPLLQTVLADSQEVMEYYEQHESHQVLSEMRKIHETALCFQKLLLDIPAAVQAEGGVPAVPSDTPPIAPSTSPQNALEQTSGERSGMVLVVEDNPLNRDLLVRYLEYQGHPAMTADHGQHALDLLAARSFDLILLDIMMPVMNGFEMLAVLKRHPIWREIPVLMISAVDEMSSVARCIEMGAEDFLSKPFDAVLLNARVKACLEKKRLRDMEIEYLRQVRILTDAAAAVETDTFSPDSLTEVAGRADELGQLARIFQQMAYEVAVRQQRLQHQVQALQIELDDVRQQRRLKEITETEYFRQLRSQADTLRGLMRDT